MAEISEGVIVYNTEQQQTDEAICRLLANEISRRLPEAENKIWHRHPVWFLEGNPIVGYSKEKRGIRLIFWSGAGFEEEQLNVRGGKFKDASVFYRSEEEVDTTALQRWLGKAREIQWDYKNIVKRKGVLERLT